EGTGTVLGCDLRHSSRDLRGRVGYMPEAAAIVPMLKGVEFVGLAGDLYGMPHRDARRRAHEVLNYVGLGELRYRRLEEYSTGNLQRLKLAAALVHDPELLLLDEPTNGLDPGGRSSMLRLIEDLITETGKSVILCTHLLGDVERLCRQVVVLHRGTVIRSGRLDELRATFGNRFEVGCEGTDQAIASFMASLRTIGIAVSTNNRPGHAVLTVPMSWRTARLFEAARDNGVVLTHLKPEEEDLEQMFFRVTDETTPSEEPAGAGLAQRNTADGT
ncbi:MAG: ABC transporter ATP-binding protein, partial [Planctomycetes bacterium]|nr:ABC transporter ATP-binding protein [Planctomycetota bacterium]